MDKDAVDAVAEAWASVDGNLDEYNESKDAPKHDAERDDYYENYQSNAAELIHDLEDRGYLVIRDTRLKRASA